ncbi:hypothetical protein BDW75DRAFT_216103 [Aspergillus navahoensis]
MQITYAQTLITIFWICFALEAWGYISTGAFKQASFMLLLLLTVVLYFLDDRAEGKTSNGSEKN